jgi:hypothetical protein
LGGTCLQGAPTLSPQATPRHEGLEDVTGSASHPIIRPRSRRAARHYHVLENAIGDPLGYRDDVFASRRQAEATARTRAQWLALAGLHIEALSGSGRWLITTRRAGDPGRLLEVEACEDAGCLEANYDSVC